MDNKQITIAIDLGSTSTRVARERAGDWPEVLHVGARSACIPSTAVLKNDGSLLFGDEADDVALNDPRHYLTGFLHLLGTRRPVLGRYAARELVAAFLAWLRDRVMACPDMQGESIGKVVLTCPVCFSQEQQDELLEASAKANLPEVVIVFAHEAVAAAYCARFPDKAFTQCALVVNWGGGAAEVACVVRREDGDVTQVRGYGDASRGGHAIDAAMRSLVLDKLRNTNGLDSVEVDMLSPVRVQQSVCEVKRRLSVGGAEHCLFCCLNRGYMYTTAVSRAEYVRILSPVTKSVVDSLKTLHSKASLLYTPEIVLLAGGMAVSDYVNGQLTEALPHSLKNRNLAELPEAVVQGAVLLGQYRTPGVHTEESIPHTDTVPDLYQAVKQGSVKELLVALRAGADANRADSTGTCPLMYAVLRGDADCVRVLLEHGALVDTTDRHGYTPLHVALRAPSPDCLSQLIAAGADVNRFTPNGWTPLGYAAMRNHVSCVRLLLQAPGITPLVPNAYGENALHVAEKFGHDECARLLRKRG